MIMVDVFHLLSLHLSCLPFDFQINFKSCFMVVMLQCCQTHFLNNNTMQLFLKFKFSNIKTCFNSLIQFNVQIHQISFKFKTQANFQKFKNKNFHTWADRTLRWYEQRQLRLPLPAGFQASVDACRFLFWYLCLPLFFLLALCYDSCIAILYTHLPCSHDITFPPHPITLLFVCLFCWPCES